MQTPINNINSGDLATPSFIDSVKKLCHEKDLVKLSLSNSEDTMCSLIRNLFSILKKIKDAKSLDSQSKEELKNVLLSIEDVIDSTKILCSFEQSQEYLFNISDLLVNNGKSKHIQDNASSKEQFLGLLMDVVDYCQQMYNKRNDLYKEVEDLVLPTYVKMLKYPFDKLTASSINTFANINNDFEILKAKSCAVERYLEKLRKYCLEIDKIISRIKFSNEVKATLRIARQEMMQIYNKSYQNSKQIDSLAFNLKQINDPAEFSLFLEKNNSLCSLFVGSNENTTNSYYHSTFENPVAKSLKNLQSTFINKTKQSDDWAIEIYNNYKDFAKTTTVTNYLRDYVGVSFPQDLKKYAKIITTVDTQSIRERKKVFHLFCAGVIKSSSQFPPSIATNLRELVTNNIYHESFLSSCEPQFHPALVKSLIDNLNDQYTKEYLSKNIDLLLMSYEIDKRKFDETCANDNPEAICSQVLLEVWKKVESVAVKKTLNSLAYQNTKTLVEKLHLNLLIKPNSQSITPGKYKI